MQGETPPPPSHSEKKEIPLDPPVDLHPLDFAWTPDKNFPGVFIAVDETGNCVLSGPKERLDLVRAQIQELVYQKLGIEVTNDIRTIQFDTRP